MRWYYNLKVSAKLIIGFIIIAVIAAIIGAVGIINLNTMNKSTTEMYERHTLQTSELTPVAESYQLIRIGLRDMAVKKDAASKTQLVTDVHENFSIIEKNLELFKEGMVDPRIIAEYEKLSNAISKEFTAYSEAVIQLATSNQEDKALEMLYSEGAALNVTISDSISNLVALKLEVAEASAERNASMANVAITTMTIAIAVGVILAILLGMFISNIIGRPVKQLAEAADKLALGDINVHVEAASKDEIGVLTHSFKQMIENIRNQAMTAEKIANGDLTINVAVRSENDLLGKKLSEMVEKNNEVLTHITSASEQVASGARQISDSSIALSQGATEQASSIEQLTASIEQISAQTKYNAEHANEANQLAETAKINAEQGNEQMQEMLKAMEEINDSSANISKIIKVIDEIAFQTNILALNAAVEAARAGQHGKGFAVVAEEVRNLAARSANAAKETTDMIESSIKKVEDGTKIANETANALGEIVTNVEKVAALINDITIASNEQAIGIAQINQGVMQVSQVVQTNAATSEESAAASEELSSQAELLKEQVSRFHLKKESFRSTYRDLESINPEVLRMLENMGRNNEAAERADAEYHSSNESSAAPKIVLSDREFGKY